MAEGGNPTVSQSAKSKPIVYLKDYQPSDYTIATTHLEFEVFDQHTLVHSRLQLQKTDTKAAIRPLFLHGENLELMAIAIDGQPLSSEAYQLVESGLLIAQPAVTFELAITTKILPHKNLSLEGLYLSNGMYCTQCEAEGFRKITFYLDRPDVMSVYTVRISADRKQYPVLLSNGNCVGRGQLDNGRHFVEWHDPHKKPSYLFALVAGDLAHVEDTFTTCSGRQVALQIFVETKDLDKCAHAMRSLKQAMRWDEEVYGREYDLDLYMIVAVDFFNMGAMENKGLNIFNTSCVLAHPKTQTDAAFQRVEAVIAHEYFHNWSGNRVTCRDWFQLSLKEGFTVFRDACFSADMNSATVKRIEDVNLLRTAQFAEDAGPLAHPIRPESFIEISNFYTLTVYEKGAEVIRMLYQLLGAEKFRAGSDLYFSRHDGQAVTCEDFVCAMEEASGTNLQQFRYWYSQAGTPQLLVSDSWNEALGRYTLTVKQSCGPSPRQPNKEPFYMPLNMALIDDNGVIDNSVQTLIVSQPSQSWHFDGLSGKPVPSLLRGFSAPVKLNFDYSFEQMLQLMQRETDGFVQWDMSRRYLLSLIKAHLDGRICIDQPQGEAYVASYARVLEMMWSDSLEGAAPSTPSQNVDYAKLAELLQLPTHAYLVEQFDTVDITAIVQAVELLQSALCESLRAITFEMYTMTSKWLLQAGDYRPEASDIALRSLKNTALSYCLYGASNRAEKNETGQSSILSLAEKQFETADNMTDQAAALHALLKSDLPKAWQKADSLLEKFYQQWSTESLVVNQWLTMQVIGNAPHCITRVKALQQHEAYDETNPNKVRALIGAFCGQNLPAFHDASGAAYALLVDEVIRLDQINPQLAARLLTPLTRWKRYVQPQSHLMLAQLKRLAARASLSADVFEVTQKALGD